MLYIYIKMFILGMNIGFLLLLFFFVKIGSHFVVVAGLELDL